MRPLPRVHAFTDGSILAHPELGIRAAAIAAGGSAVALYARAPGGTGAFLTAAALRLIALARPPEAAVLVGSRSDVAAAVGAHGVQLGSDDLDPAAARRILVQGWIGRSIHSGDEAARAVEEGADYLVAGNIYETDSHPGRPAAGLELVRKAAGLGVPVIAIGGITPLRAAEVKSAGAYGVAAIRALWQAPDPAQATIAMLAPWVSET